MSDPVRVLVRNPQSGDGRKTRRAREIALARGYDVLDTDDHDHTAALAAEAAGRADVVAACGGDGTLNGTVAGVRRAGELESVVLGVVPAGTGNDFADNLGVRDVRHAFDLIESGRVRRLDLGVGNGRPFLNSCVGGLTAEASARTSPERKRRLGVLAYVLTTLSIAREYDSPALHVSVGPDRDPVWSGDARLLLVGNGRRFPGEGPRQADMEDGLLNVVIVEEAPALSYLAEGAAQKLFRRGASYLTRVRAAHLHVTHDDGPAVFSLDGEMIRTDELGANIEAGVMQFVVGPTYRPDPGDRNASA